MVIFEYMYFTK